MYTWKWRSDPVNTKHIHEDMDIIQEDFSTATSSDVGYRKLVFVDDDYWY